MPASSYKIAYSEPETGFSGARGPAGSEGKKSCQIVKYYQWPWAFSEIPGLFFAAGLAYGVIVFKAAGSDVVKIGAGTLAKCMGINRKTARRLLCILKRAGLIKSVSERNSTRYYLTYIMGRCEYLPVFADLLERRRFNLSKLAVLHYIWWRQGVNGWCWSKQRDIARDLGLSLRTVRRCIAWLRAHGLIQVRPRGNNHKAGNKYAVTIGAGLPVRDNSPKFSEVKRAIGQKTTEENRVSGPKSHRPKRDHPNKNRALRVILNGLRPDFPRGILSPAEPRASPDPQRVYLRLVNIRVNGKVARPMAFDQLHPYESVDQAIKNGEVLRLWQQRECRSVGLPPPRFNLAGYVVRALNGARSEGKIIGTTRLFREMAAMSKAIKAARAKAADWQPPSETEFDRRRRAMKRALGLPEDAGQAEFDQRRRRSS